VTAARTHLVVGERDAVLAALARAHADDRLLGVGNVLELPGDRLQVTAELRTAPGRPQKRWPWWLAGGVVAAAAIAGMVWLLILAITALVAAVTSAVTAVVAWLSAHLPLLVLAGLALLLVLGWTGSRCAGLQCRGCRG
jgi:hypothetical protein